MKARLLAVIVASLLISTAHAATITIQSPASVSSGSSVTLADVASITGATKADVEKLGSIQIASAPLPGYTRTLDLHYVKLRIKSVYGDLSDLKINAPEKLLITAKSTLIKGKDIATTAKEYLLSRLPVDGKRYEAEVTRTPADSAVPEGKLEMKVQMPATSVITGPRSAVVTIAVDGKERARVTVFVYVRAFAEVLVAKSPIPQKGQLTEAKTAWETRDVSRVRAPITRDADLSSLVASRSIPAGAVVASDMLMAPAAVESGSPVTIVVQGKRLRLSARGTAMQSGRPGDTIRVVAPFGRGEVRAVVVEPGLVEVSI